MFGKLCRGFIKPVLGLNFNTSNQIFYSIFLGVLVGLVFREKVVFIKILGDVFIRMIKMTVVPLIFISVAHVFCTMQDTLKFGKIAIQCIVIFLVTTFLTSILGIILALIFQPGINTGINPNAFAIIAKTTQNTNEVSLSGIISNIFPDNPFKSFAEGNIMQILIFAIFFGLSVNCVSSKAKNVVIIINELAGVISQLVTIVIKFAPIGIFGLITYLAATQNPTALISLLKLLVLFYAAGFIILLIFYPLILLAFGLNPIPFIKKMFEVQYFAFLTSSSTAAIPLTKFTSEKSLGVTNGTASFVVPLGATINMNGTSLHLGVTSIFLAQVAGIDLHFTQYIHIVVLCIVIAVGTAGVPGASILMMPVILITIGVPPEYDGIYVGIDRFLDMLRSTINVSGDALTCVIVDKIGKRLDIKKYNSKKTQRFISHK
jgi:Na+/H+-dicarboxylate symporter